MNRVKGFTLVELMIVLVIIGIIAGIAVPSYNSYVVRGHRAEGMAFMLDIMRAQEDYYATYYTYTATLANINYAGTVSTESGSYIITAAKCGSDDLDECINLIGTPQDNQASDGTLQLNSRGTRYRGTDTTWSK